MLIPKSIAAAALLLLPLSAAVACDDSPRNRRWRTPRGGKKTLASPPSPGLVATDASAPAKDTSSGQYLLAAEATETAALFESRPACSLDAGDLPSPRVHHTMPPARPMFARWCSETRQRDAARMAGSVGSHTIDLKS